MKHARKDIRKLKRRIRKSINRQGQRFTDWLAKFISSCISCRRLRAFGSHNFCSQCRRQIPPALRWAMLVSGDYALQLDSGEVLRFSRCFRHDDWLKLENPDTFQGCSDRIPYPCPEGIYIRIKDIVWCADHPMRRATP